MELAMGPVAAAPVSGGPSWWVTVSAAIGAFASRCNQVFGGSTT